MRVLVANNHLDTIGGTENYTYAIVAELRRLGHEVEYFTFRQGQVSRRIERELGVPFLRSRRFDLVLASHSTTVEAVGRLGFSVQTCHGIYPDIEQPSPKADAYVSISQEVQDHLGRLGYPSALILNGIDCDRFRPKRPPRDKLGTVLCLCQSESANQVVRDACEQLGLTFMSINKFERTVWEIEDLINEADLVVGLGRSVYDAMACGRPAIVFDSRWYMESLGDGYIPENLGFSIQANCSGRRLRKRMDVEDMTAELQRYDPKHSSLVREFAVSSLNIRSKVEDYLRYAVSRIEDPGVTVHLTHAGYHLRRAAINFPGAVARRLRRGLVRTEP